MARVLMLWEAAWNVYEAAKWWKRGRSASACHCLWTAGVIVRRGRYPTTEECKARAKAATRTRRP